jgi:hypothetical protein
MILALFMLLNIVIKLASFNLFTTKVVSLADSSGKPYGSTQLELLFGQPVGRLNLILFTAEKKNAYLKWVGSTKWYSYLKSKP